MTTQAQSTSGVSETSIQSSTFERFAGVCAILVGLGGILYAVAFVVLKNSLLYSLFLLLGGLLSTAVLTAVYNRLRKTAALLLVVLYLGRLILFDPTNPVILVTAVFSGFLVNPLWYLWLGVTLLRSR